MVTPDGWKKCKYCDFRLQAHLLLEDEFICGFCQMIDGDQVKERVTAAIQRGYKWYTNPIGKPALIVGGAPSLKKTWKQVKEFQSQGGVVFACNGAYPYLLKKGVNPEYFVMMDGREENTKFLSNPSKTTEHMIASSVHPRIFDLLEGYNVTLWHVAINRLYEDLAPIIRQYSPHPAAETFIGGGSTVCLRALFMAVLMHFRDIRLFGMDSSCQSGQHHAYEQKHNDEDTFLKMGYNGREYSASIWMQRQVFELVEILWEPLLEKGCFIWAYGEGLLPDAVRDRNALIGRVNPLPVSK